MSRRFSCRVIITARSFDCASGKPCVRLTPCGSASLRMTGLVKRGIYLYRPTGAAFVFSIGSGMGAFVAGTDGPLLEGLGA